MGIVSMEEDFGGDLCKSLETSCAVTEDSRSGGVERNVATAASLSLLILLVK